VSPPSLLPPEATASQHELLTALLAGQALTAGVKVPLMFFLSLIVCFPAFFLLQFILGSKMKLMQMAAVILAGFVLTGAIMVSFTPIIIFFVLTGGNYHFLQLLHVGVYAVAWGFARAASGAGVDIVEHCEVTGIRRNGARVTGVETTRGHIGAETVCLAVAGHSSRLASMAGVTLPIETHVLQAFVTESIKPILDVVMTYGAGHFYVSQSDRGGLVYGGAIDGYNSYAQRGTLPMAEEVAAAALTVMPALARLKVVRQWGGVMDMSMDGSPIISRTPLEGLLLNGGWCYGGFKAIPAGGMTTAHLIATGNPHPLAAHLALDRFATGRTIDERGLGPFPYAH